MAALSAVPEIAEAATPASAPPPAPSYDAVVTDLKRLRERGLLRIRGLSLPALTAIAAAVGYQDIEARTLEQLLRRGAERLGEDEFGIAARYLFGLVQGTFGRKPTDLRERAAQELGVSSETFRKDQERLIVGRLAEELLTLAAPIPAPARPTSAIHQQGGQHPAGSVTSGSDSPVGSSLDPSPQALPKSVVHFTGREHEVGQLQTTLLAGAGAVCVVHGMPGTGKSALAIEVSHRLSGSFPDGVIVLELATHTPAAVPQSPREVMARLLLRLGASPDAVPPDVDDVAAALSHCLVGRTMLIVLDDVASAGQVLPLLNSSGRCAVLITSRKRLTALDASRHLHLTILPRSASRTLFTRVAGLPQPDEPLVDRIAQLCADLPLALRILAARHRLDPYPDLGGLLARLSQEHERLRELDDGTRGVAATFELSLCALAAPEHRTLLLLAQVPGTDLSPEAAASLLDCPSSEAHRLLENLEAANLVERRQAQRYGLHDLIAIFARSKSDPPGRPDPINTSGALEPVGILRPSGEAGHHLPASETATALGRLADWYLRSLDAADHRLAPHRYRIPLVAGTGPALAFPDYRQALGWVSEEVANLVALTQQTAPRGLDAHCWQLAYLLKSYLYLTKDWAAWRESHQPALEATRRLGERWAEAITLNSLGLAALEEGEIRAAEQHYRFAHYLFEQAGDLHGVHTALANLSWVAYADGDYEHFLTDLGAAHRFYRAEGMERNAAISLRGLALGELRSGRPQRAIERAQAALESFRRLGGAELDAVITLNNLAEAQQAAGLAEAAEVSSTQAADQARTCGSSFEEARALARLGELNEAVDPDAAAAHWSAALELYTRLHAPEAKQVRDRLERTR